MIFDLTQDRAIRLSLIRYLLRQAEQQTKQPAPVHALAVLSLHDAAEMFLDLATEAAEAPVARRMTFMEFWDSLEKANPPIALPARRQMEKLNRARVDLKHQGLRASDDQVQEHLIHTRDFLDESCEICFGTPLKQISVVSLIRNSEVRNLVDEALRSHALEEFTSSLTNAAIAFAIAVPTIRRGFYIPSGSIATVGRSMGAFGDDAVDSEGRRATERLAREHGKALRDLLEKA